ncbi:MAG: hypothetical protein R3D33_00500 [Hyphomicrobiaceae bacterium]
MPASRSLPLPTPSWGRAAKARPGRFNISIAASLQFDGIGLVAASIGSIKSSSSHSLLARKRNNLAIGQALGAVPWRLAPCALRERRHDRAVVAFGEGFLRADDADARQCPGPWPNRSRMCWTNRPPAISRSSIPATIIGAASARRWTSARGPSAHGAWRFTPLRERVLTEIAARITRDQVYDVLDRMAEGASAWHRSRPDRAIEALVDVVVHRSNRATPISPAISCHRPGTSALVLVCERCGAVAEIADETAFGGDDGS